MLILRLGENIEKRNDCDKSLPNKYTSLGAVNILEIFDFVQVGFFGDKTSIKILDIQDEKVRDLFYKNIDILAKSENTFFIDELSLNKATEDKLIREVLKCGGVFLDARYNKQEEKDFKDIYDNPFFFYRLFHKER